ncbi:MAG: hypothetical protein WKF31_10505 [Thermoleophilaceae bacterium]
MRHGPAVVLGDLGDLKVKWAATARVLADPASRGAAYVDVRMPERPVAGGLVEPAAEAGADAQPAGSVAGSPPAAVPAAGADAGRNLDADRDALRGRIGFGLGRSEDTSDVVRLG